MNSILVTGGAGFIGSHYINQIKDHIEEQIIIVDKLTYAGDLKNIKSINNDQVVFYHGDICDVKFMTNIFKKHNIVGIINFAAETHVDKSIDSSVSFFETNVLGVLNLMDISRKFWSEDEFFLQISTDEVYGSSKSLEDVPKTEDAPLKPSNPYAASKGSAELLMQSYINTYRYPCKIVRLTNVYGVNQNQEKFIPTSLKALLNQTEIPLYGNGLYYRNWQTVEDACKCIEKVRISGSIGEVYNIAGPGLVSNLTVIDTITEVLKELNLPYKKAIQQVKDRLGHDLCYLVDDSKFRKLYAYEKTSLKSGLKNMIQKLYFD
ncbi:MAG: GDP-mannose 4,6-dehydratase [Clostridia bacterium]|nr:GDP-mannose 4,6-dehydratase [Clostridia bacterium]